VSPACRIFPKTRAFIWKKDRLLLLEQRLLPHRVVWRTCRHWRQVEEGIRLMVVRGAPAIGCVAAYGIVLAARSCRNRTLNEQRQELIKASEGLLKARPTAVNLHWALERMRRVWEIAPVKDPESLAKALERKAIRMEEEDRQSNRRMGRYGADLLPRDASVMTICNTGSLATAGLGTAFGILWTAFHDKKIRKVIASETRPYLQGARLTAWELQQEKIPFELMTDNMAAHLMKTEKVDAVIVGADRIAANGDTANKIGTYSLAVLAAHHGIPFYVAAPTSTVDLTTADGRKIPIEERSAEEVVMVRGQRIAPKGTHARHPAFDVTPANLITAIVTEQGVARKPYKRSLKQLMNDHSLTPSLSLNRERGNGVGKKIHAPSPCGGGGVGRG
jgi:methylthioribose-1-phosphate isomerase